MQRNKKSGCFIYGAIYYHICKTFGNNQQLKISNQFSKYVKSISKIFYCIYSKAYISRIYSPNCTLKRWIALEI